MVRNKKNQKNQWTMVMMVNPEQIAGRKYIGCTTTRAVQSFCNRYNVNSFWWTPPDGTRKLFMIDYHNFWNCWKQIYGKEPQFAFSKSYNTGSTRSTTKGNRRSTSRKTHTRSQSTYGNYSNTTRTRRTRNSRTRRTA